MKPNWSCRTPAIFRAAIRAPNSWTGCWARSENAAKRSATWWLVSAVEVFQPRAREEIRLLSFLVGAYQGQIHPKTGEKVVALGDCACWSGEIEGKQVDISSVYKPHLLRDLSQARCIPRERLADLEGERSRDMSRSPGVQQMCLPACFT
jgi:hypothetical protein